MDAPADLVALVCGVQQSSYDRREKHAENDPHASVSEGIHVRRNT